DQHDLLAVLHLDGADQLAVALVGHHGDHALATAALLRELLDRRALAVAALGGGEDLRMLFGKIGKHTSELQSRENLVCRLLLAPRAPPSPPPSPYTTLFRSRSA